MIGLCLPEVETPEVMEEMEVESCLPVVMLPVEETCVIPICLSIVTTPTPHLLICAIS